MYITESLFYIISFAVNECPVLQNVTNGNFSNVNCTKVKIEFNKTCEVICNPGYFIDENIFYCNEYGSWNSTAHPVCESECLL